MSRTRFNPVFIALGIGVIGLVALGLITQVSAFSGRDMYYGYFYNKYENHGSDVIAGGITISGSTQQARVNNFMATLVSKYNNGGNDRVGAAFIYRTMMGYGPGASASVSDFGKLKTRLDALVASGGRIDLIQVDIGGLRNTYIQNSHADVAWLYMTGWWDAYVFRDRSGKDLYLIKRDCGNPLGELGGIPEPRQWSVNGQSYAKIGSRGTRAQGENAITAKPGDRVYWDHTLRNTGPNAMDRNVAYWIQRQDRSLETGLELSFSGGSASQIGNGAANGSTFYNGSVNSLLSQDSVGKKLCQRVAWRDRSWNRYGEVGYSNYACVNVPYNYELVPSIQNIPMESIPEGTDRISVEGAAPGIDNNIGSTKSKSTKNAVVRFVVRGDVTTDLPAGEDTTVTGSNWGCDVAQQIGVKNSVTVDSSPGVCDVLASNSDEVIGPEGKKFTEVREDDISSLGSLAIGDRICYVVIVSGYNQNVGNNTFRYSQSACVHIAKRPKVQILGADVRVGSSISGDSSIRTGNTQRNGRLYGSWAEYGMFAPGAITSASGAGLSGVDGRELTTNYNALTFANTPGFGKFGVMPQTTLSPEYINMSSTSEDLSIDGSNVQPVIKTTGTVTITGDIIYGGEDAQHTSVFNLPQYVIIAKDIIIGPNVTRVDAWLISQGGYISTCDAVSNQADPFAGLNATTCDQQLRINGPVVADRLFLRRTAGSGRDDPGSPAEIISVRPDVYLWAYSQSMSTSAIKTLYIRELPPRF